MAAGKVIPTELQAEAEALRKEIELDGSNLEESTTSKGIDDEYAYAGVEDPKIIVTTSRDASSRLKAFSTELRLIFPNAKKINRGNYQIKAIVDACRRNNVTDLVLVTETRGEPDGLVVSHFPSGPTAFFGMANVVMRHDLPERATVSEAFPHLIFHDFTSPLGERVKSILKFLFPVPRAESTRVMSFINQSDYISFRHHQYTRNKASRLERRRQRIGADDDSDNEDDDDDDGERELAPDIALEEVGPRFELRLYKIRLGTLDETAADDEFVLRPYHNTAKRRRLL